MFRAYASEEDSWEVPEPSEPPACVRLSISPPFFLLLPSFFPPFSLLSSGTNSDAHCYTQCGSGIRNWAGHDRLSLRTTLCLGADHPVCATLFINCICVAAMV